MWIKKKQKSVKQKTSLTLKSQKIFKAKTGPCKYNKTGKTDYKREKKQSKYRMKMKNNGKNNEGKIMNDYTLIYSESLNKMNKFL